jgi:hypothetical protein
MADGEDRWSWNREDNDTADWIELDISGIQSKDKTPVPYKLFVTRFKSSSPDSEAYLHDPLRFLMEDAAKVPAFGVITTEWRVISHVGNHEDTLSASHVHVNVTVDEDKKLVTSTVVKQPKAGTR